jgi:hypothetical protein
MRATATRRLSEPRRQRRPELDHLRPRLRGRYRHPNRAESAVAGTGSHSAYIAWPTCLTVRDKYPPDMSGDQVRVWGVTRHT